ncbi:hypothetical protein Droror1_Dr00003644 [Drosera rotundifolia]
MEMAVRFGPAGAIPPHCSSASPHFSHLSLPFPFLSPLQPQSCQAAAPAATGLLSPPLPPFPFFPALPLSHLRRRARARPPSPPADPTPPPAASSSDISPGIRHHLHPQTPRRHHSPADTTNSPSPHRSRRRQPVVVAVSPWLSPVLSSPCRPHPPNSHDSNQSSTSTPTEAKNIWLTSTQPDSTKSPPGHHSPQQLPAQVIQLHPQPTRDFAKPPTLQFARQRDYNTHPQHSTTQNDRPQPGPTAPPPPAFPRLNPVFNFGVRMGRFCTYCTKVQATTMTPGGLICCSGCGKVVGENFFSDEPTFVKNATGQSRLAGNVVRSVDSGFSASRARTLANAQEHMERIAVALGISGGDSLYNQARRFYELALEENFTRGRNAEHVAAACLYMTCREQKKEFLLIEFSDYLAVNVYVLGGVFLQLCKVLNLEEHPLVQKPVDPSIFIHRFAYKFLEGRTGDFEGEQLKRKIIRSALRIMISMKRDWMQTGRKPSGLCGAALYISALSHGIKVSKSEIVKHVHVCEATLTKRLVEFENTDSGGLTIEELNEKAQEWESNYNNSVCLVEPSEGELLCVHKNEKDGKEHFAHGLCAACYKEFVELSGGLDGGAEPPAFQHAERARMAQSCSIEHATVSPGQAHLGSEEQQHENRTSCEQSAGFEKSNTSESCCSTGIAEEHETPDGVYDELNKGDIPSRNVGDESEIFSDVDDSEVDHYLHTEEEKILKKRIWEAVNWEYLEEQAAKEAAAAAREANFQGCSEEDLAKRDLVAQTAAALALSRKEKRERREAEAKKVRTAAEATHNVLSQKKLSSKINYDKLKEIFDTPDSTDIGQTKKTDQHSEDRDDKVEQSLDAVEDYGYSYYGDQGEDAFELDF